MIIKNCDFRNDSGSVFAAWDDDAAVDVDVDFDVIVVVDVMAVVVVLTLL